MGFGGVNVHEAASNSTARRGHGIFIAPGAEQRLRAMTPYRPALIFQGGSPGSRRAQKNLLRGSLWPHSSLGDVFPS